MSTTAFQWTVVILLFGIGVEITQATRSLKEISFKLSVMIKGEG